MSHYRTPLSPSSSLQFVLSVCGFLFFPLLLLFNQYSILCVKIFFCFSLRKCSFVFLFLIFYSAIRRNSNDVIEQNETMIVARNIDIGYVFLLLSFGNRLLKICSSVSSFFFLYSFFFGWASFYRFTFLVFLPFDSRVRFFLVVRFPFVKKWRERESESSRLLYSTIFHCYHVLLSSKARSLFGSMRLLLFYSIFFSSDCIFFLFRLYSNICLWWSFGCCCCCFVFLMKKKLLYQGFYYNLFETRMYEILFGLRYIGLGAHVIPFMITSDGFISFGFLNMVSMISYRLSNNIIIYMHYTFNM